MSKIYLKYILIHLNNFEHSMVIMNMKLSSRGFPFHRNINRRENKFRNHSSQWEKTKNTFDVQQKIAELHKLVKCIYEKS